MLYNGAMFDRPNPLIYFAAALPVSLLAVVIAYRLAARYRKSTTDEEGWAWGLGHTAMFGLIALILGFSYSHAADQYQARSALVVKEANVIRAAFLGAGFLPGADVLRFRNTLIDYARTCLKVYAAVGDAAVERAAIAESENQRKELWRIASSDPGAETRFDIMGAVIAIEDTAAEQTAAFNSHVPGVIIGLVALSTVSGAFLFGLSLGRAKFPNAVLTILFCVLFSATFFTIIDLDQPHGGFIGIDVSPLQSTLDYMLKK
jgi:hypothetical protein